jgi:hypothetical protein
MLQMKTAIIKKVAAANMIHKDIIQKKNSLSKPKSGNHYIMEQVDDDAGKPKIYKWIYQATLLYYGTSG